MADLKGLLLQSEDALPTLEQNLATSTASSTGATTLPTITADASTYGKFAGSLLMGVAGMLFLGYGKKTNDVQKMLIGAALTIASALLF